MRLYLVKIGINLFEYEWLTNNLSIYELNKNERLLDFPRFNNDDYNMIIYKGGTICYSEGGIMYWLVNRDHIFDSDSVSRDITLYNIISVLKRDIKLTSIIGDENFN